MKLSTEDFSQRARAFSNIHQHKPTQAFAGNLDTDVDSLDIDGITIPVSVNKDGEKNAWVCSPKTTYIDYAAEEAERYLPGILRPPNRLLFNGVRFCLKNAKIDRAVAINNWLLSTNLYPEISEATLHKLISIARERWPDHAIWFRSLNQHDNANLLDLLSAKGFQLIASRQVYLYSNFHRLADQHINLKRDLKLLSHNAFKYVDNSSFLEDDYARIARLYEQLYIEKYSRFNPHYNAAFMRAWHQAGLLKFEGFRNQEGELLAAIGLFRQGNIYTAPIVGYDTRLPIKLGLYRLLTACAYRTTMQNNARLNFSAGAAHFKRLRGGLASIEYSAVYASHLPARTRATISALSIMTRKIGTPLMARYKL
jgi:hypothetical protein